MVSVGRGHNGMVIVGPDHLIVAGQGEVKVKSLKLCD